MSVSLVITQNLAEELRAIASLETETAGVMLARIVETTNGNHRLLARAIRWVDEVAYERRDWNGLTIRPEGYINALAEAEVLQTVCIWVHTHPGMEATPISSRFDRVVDREIEDLFRLRSGSPYYGSLIFSPRMANLAFTGYLQREGDEARQITRLWQVGDRWRLLRQLILHFPNFHLSSIETSLPLDQQFSKR